MWVWISFTVNVLLYSQYWLIWQSRLTERKTNMLKQFAAVRHCNTAQVKRCFTAWITYWQRGRQKKQEKGECSHSV